MAGWLALGRLWSPLAVTFPVLQLSWVSLHHSRCLSPFETKMTRMSTTTFSSITRTGLQVGNLRPCFLAGLLFPEALTCGLSSGCRVLGGFHHLLTLFCTQISYCPPPPFLGFYTLSYQALLLFSAVTIFLWIAELLGCHFGSLKEDQGLIMCPISYESFKVPKTSELTSTPNLLLPERVLLPHYTAQTQGYLASPNCQILLVISGYS